MYFPQRHKGLEGIQKFPLAVVRVSQTTQKVTKNL
jgi:hypothetical protein